MTPARWTLIAAVVALFTFTAQAWAQEFVEVPLSAPSIELAPQLKYFDTEKRNVSVQLPSASGAQPQMMALEAKGDAAPYRWAYISLRNVTYEPAEVVVVIPYQNFVGSGLFWPRLDGTRVARVMVSSGASPAFVNDVGSDSMAIRMEPASSVTVALQVTSGFLEGATLWQRAAFDSRTDSHAFFRGVVIGIAILMTVIMMSLYAVRSSLAFPSASLFALASVGFIAIEVGYLPVINSGLPAFLQLNGQTRVVIEGLMLTGVILCLTSFLQLRRRYPLWGNALFIAAGLSLLLPVYGWFEPQQALGLIRILFAAVVIGGFAIVLVLWRDGFSRAQASLLSWSTLMAWMVVAAVAVFATGSQASLRPVVVAGLALVLLTMAFTLAQFAFSQGILSRRFFDEAGRRALALSASQQFVWDWQVEDQDLYVGEEIERTLGLAPGFFAENGVDGLLELIHPLDRRAYLAAVESAERRGKGTFTQDFRLRGGDGIYRWFELRARMLGGGDQRAVRCIGTMTDITNRKRSEERLLNDAVYDRVTELPNRALLVDRLTRAIGQLERGEISDLFLLLIDLDRFKPLNDGLGHETGDHLLNVTGKRILGIAGPHDTVARMPGDQFAVIFVGGNPQRDAVAFTEQLRRTIARPIPMRPRDVSLTASIGVAAYRQAGQQATHMLRDAAVALYEAKRHGKDAVEFFRTSMRDERSELVALEQDLARAVERGEIEVFYQPIARLADMDLAGFEALVRWRHPIHGLLAPESFIAIAEQSGLIRDLGRHVLNEAARQLGIWQRAFRPPQPIFVSVNLSSSELIRTDLIEDVKAILSREGLARDTLKIEVTESIVMGNPELSTRILEKLRELGVGLACDDFGTGFSSLSTLRRLPFDTLKIDRSFIETEPEDTRSAVILASIAALARELGMKIVAEGIATQGQVDRLASLGCDFGQGFLIGEPMPAKHVTDALSGLPYAANRGKPAIAALWDRIRAEPTLVLQQREEEQQQAAGPLPRPYIESEPDVAFEARRHQPEPEHERLPEYDLRPSLPDVVSRPSPPALGTAPLAPRPQKQAMEEPTRKVVVKPAPLAPRLPKQAAEESGAEAKPEPRSMHHEKPNGAAPTKRKKASTKKTTAKKPAAASSSAKPKRKQKAKKSRAQA
jgi:diguanylate cyclase (GGDEF)-like protein/PAS domain S-box-containing protein